MEIFNALFDLLSSVSNKDDCDIVLKKYRDCFDIPVFNKMFNERSLEILSSLDGMVRKYYPSKKFCLIEHSEDYLNEEFVILDNKPLTKSCIPLSSPTVRPYTHINNLGLKLDIVLYNNIEKILGVQGFNDYIYPLEEELKLRGYKVLVSSHYLNCNVLHIVFGLNEMSNQPPSTPFIAVQLEQLASNFFNQEYLNRLSKALEVWEFSEDSVNSLKEKGVINTFHVPLGFCKTLFTKNNVPKNQDVIFIGTPSVYRREYIEKLKNKGINVNNMHGVLIKDRDIFSDCSKLVLNIHINPSYNEEQLRILGAMQRGALVISEKSKNMTNICIYGEDSDDVFNKCKEWLNKSESERFNKVIEILHNTTNFYENIPWKRIETYVRKYNK